ncbi:hypothetical protein BS50DRAFT_162484 [Corynespora cassiicola Philippines]|uniref:Uncharacterized protein n=1 Tax=Corynespora cassiicola Philippines TaxID=1448308 RepID=A0A2T2N7L2_CORCC|nr:hypothetical protein BS50DRAFT_162484 [Corynespora cassiicola Philippines]
MERPNNSPSSRRPASRSLLISACCLPSVVYRLPSASTACRLPIAPAAIVHLAPARDVSTAPIAHRPLPSALCPSHTAHRPSRQTPLPAVALRPPDLVLRRERTFALARRLPRPSYR